MSRFLCCLLLLFAVVTLFTVQPVRSQYQVVKVRPVENGVELDLDMVNSQSSLSTPVTKLVAKVDFWREDTFRLTIRDRTANRWEVPDVVLPRGEHHARLKYNPVFTENPFSLSVTRLDDDVVIFNMTKLIFNDQYIELVDSIPNDGKSHLFGFGERVHNFRLDSTGKTYTLFSFDHGTPIDEPTYGSHPFHMQYYKKKFHGGFMLNSNAMDVTVDSSKITYKMIGGIVDLFVFVGPSSEEVLRQYHSSVVGKPKMVPFWALGNHQCRWGYEKIEDLENVVNTYEELGIPLDTAWSDIDWMQDYKVFETQSQNYPVPALQQFVSRLKSKDRHYVVIIDPGIKVEPGYSVYESGIKNDVFVKSAATGKDLVGKVWPGYTHFPDFTKPSTVAWWQNEIKSFLKKVPLSGLWIDMNEVASFVDGECFLKGNDCPVRPRPAPIGQGFDPNNPPYRPGNFDLISHTISSDAIYNTSIDYNLHTLYGFNEAKATMPALEAATGKRGLLISRSTFGGSGRYAQHWLGDNKSTWGDLFYSISGILNFQMYGIPFVGVDICGFAGDSNAELCGRWVQVGAFYPFTRNHNDHDSAPQEYYRFGDEVISIARTSILTKYSLLSYYYTLLKVASTQGGSVLRPMVFEFPNSNYPDLPYLDRQFMVGSSLMVIPVLEPGQSYVNAYIPDESRWYDFFTGNIVVCSGNCGFETPFEKINVLIREGHSILLHAVVEKLTLTTAQARRDGFRLLIARDGYGQSRGFTYIDDGDSIDSIDYIKVEYSHVKVSEKVFRITSLSNQAGSVDNINTNLKEVVIYGVPSIVVSVVANSQNVNFKFDDNLRTLTIDLSSVRVDITNINIEYKTQ